MPSVTIKMTDIRLWGYHGCLPQERTIGAQYSIDVELYFNSSKAEKTDCLIDTIDYPEVYEVIKKSFASPVNLMEHLCRKILDDLHYNFPKLTNSTITIHKLNPPVSGEIGAVSFTLSHK
ncbi:MAG: dihydroneopterin aldolase [Bacteroidales bacterium]|nr:dihydroneopterin aldolase [Bacteroidales bacterium]